MHSLFNRLNRNRLSMLAVAFLATVFVLSSCKKKDRLSSSTFNLNVTPPAASVLKNQSLTLTAFGNSGRGPVEVSPTWTIVSGPGSVSPNIGNEVVFTSPDLGDTRISATYDGVTTVSQIAIVTNIPTSNTFLVYTDAGLPTGVGADIFDSFSVVSEPSSGYTPEGIKYLRATNTTSGVNWGVAVTSFRNLSAFNGGNLKFALRLARTMTGAESLHIDLKDSNSAAVSVTLASGSFGFNRLSTDWQEISIPITTFAGLDTTTIQNPFAAVTFSVASPLTFDIDAVRWEN